MSSHRMHRRRPAPLSLVSRQSNLDDGQNTPDTPDTPDTPSPRESSFSSDSLFPTQTSIASISLVTVQPTTISDAFSSSFTDSASFAVTESFSASETSTTMAITSTSSSSSTSSSTSAGASGTSLPNEEQQEPPMLGNGPGSITLPPVAIGLLVTFTVLGGISLFVLALYCMRRKKRKENTRENVSSLTSLPPRRGSGNDKPDVEQQYRIASPPPLTPDIRLTKATSSDGSPWSAETYERPSTAVDFTNPFVDPAVHVAKPDAAVTATPLAKGLGLANASSKPSARPASSRYYAKDTLRPTSEAPPTPSSVNPFVDPEREKAYDLLRDRPRSTTLTDAGDWRRNPFMDPKDERYDPFGQLRERAKEERKKYVELLKKEQVKRAEGQ